MPPLVRAHVLGLTISLFLPLREAAAHLRLVKADPGVGARVTAPPAVTLRFSDVLTVALCRITLRDASMRAVAVDEVRDVSGDPRAMSARLRETVAPGRYTVKWLAAGADGHPVRGEFTFEVVAEASAMTESTRTADQASFSVESPAYALLRAVQSVAVIALLGILALHFMIGPRSARVATPSGHASLSAAEQAASRWVMPTLALLLVVTAARLVAQHVAFFGMNETPTLGSVSAILFQSPWGRGWLIAAAAILVGLVGARRLRIPGSAGWVLLASATLGLVSSMAMSGHAAAVSAFAMSVHAAHILAAGGWIGSLGILVLVAVPAALRAPDGAPHATIAGLMHAFSPTALAFAALVVVTGVFAAFRNVGTVDALWQSSYGLVLLVKLALLLIAATIGFFNWRRVLPVLGTDAATTRLRASAAIELIAALGMLVVTAILVATPLPNDVLDGVAR